MTIYFEKFSERNLGLSFAIPFIKVRRGFSLYQYCIQQHKPIKVICQIGIIKVLQPEKKANEKIAALSENAAFEKLLLLQSAQQQNLN